MLFVYFIMKCLDIIMNGMIIVLVNELCEFSIMDIVVLNLGVDKVELGYVLDI